MAQGPSRKVGKQKSREAMKKGQNKRAEMARKASKKSTPKGQRR